VDDELNLSREQGGFTCQTS